MSDTIRKKPFTNYNKVLLIGLFTFLIAGLIVGLKWQMLREHYHLVTGHQFERGDKLYATPLIFQGNSKNNSVPLMRMIRPLTVTDIDRMNISTVEKQTLKKGIEPDAKPYMIFSGKIADYLSLNKSHTAFVGRYIGKDVLDLKIDGEKKLIPQGVYAIEPNDDAMVGDFMMKWVKMPKNYTWQDNTYYVFYNTISHKELPRFLK